MVKRLIAVSVIAVLFCLSSCSARGTAQGQTQTVTLNTSRDQALAERVKDLTQKAIDRALTNDWEIVPAGDIAKPYNGLTKEEVYQNNRKHRDEDIVSASSVEFPYGSFSKTTLATIGYINSYLQITNMGNYSFLGEAKAKNAPVRFNSENQAYYVQEAENGGLFYTFGGFVPNTGSEEEQLQMDYFGTVYSLKVLSYNSFAKLKTGDAMDMVEAIDPATTAWNWYGTYQLPEANTERGRHHYSEAQTLHLLTDGILRVNYTLSEDDKYLIRDLEYSPDFILSRDSIYLSDGRTVKDYPVCYLIHPDDRAKSK